MGRNQRIGAWGEELAAAFLEERGYQLVGRNIRTPHGEIDIIAKQQNLWVFVEVKARTSDAFGPPEIAVGPRKQAHMRASADHYAQVNDVDHWRIDVIAVERTEGQPRITHFQNAIS